MIPELKTLTDIILWIAWGGVWGFAGGFIATFFIYLLRPHSTAVGWSCTHTNVQRAYTIGWGINVPLLPRIGWSTLFIWASIARYRVSVTRRIKKDDLSVTVTGTYVDNISKGIKKAAAATELNRLGPYRLDEVYEVDAQLGASMLPENSVDLMLTDPPYGYKFMGKRWDVAVPSADTWREVLRALKPGGFCFAMSAPRQDVLGLNIARLTDAGFKTAFSPIYWAYASGFPKAQNIGKAVDKRMGAEREVVGKHPNPAGSKGNTFPLKQECDITAPATPEAQALDGSYAGFQPKPAVEVILVAMKPLSEKTYLDQALANGKGITWLDDCRIPFQGDGDFENAKGGDTAPSSESSVCYGTGWDNAKKQSERISPSGRFPANLLVSDDALNDGRVSASGSGIKLPKDNKTSFWGNCRNPQDIEGVGGDSGSFSRYFSLDAWWADRVSKLPKQAQRTFPFLLVPKPSKREKNAGCEKLEERFSPTMGDGIDEVPHNEDYAQPKRNAHPTVKPLQLASWLVTLGSREGDIVLDPFAGSGTFPHACILQGRRTIGFDNDPDSITIARARLEHARDEMALFAHAHETKETI